MPSHQDRVRRNYHEVKTEVVDSRPTMGLFIKVSVTRMMLTTMMSRREVEYFVHKSVDTGIKDLVALKLIR